jgi:CBS domain-containing protein
MKVKDILDVKGYEFESVGPNTTVGVAMDTIIQKGIGSLLIMNNDTLIGIISERDIFRLYHKYGQKATSITVDEVMTKDIIIGLPEDDVEAVKALMTNNRFRHLPILDGSKVVGIVSIGDVVKSMATDLKIENRYLKDYITGKYPG